MTYDTLFDQLLVLSHSVNLAISHYKEILWQIFVDTHAKSLTYKINSKGLSIGTWGIRCIIGIVANKVSL